MADRGKDTARLIGFGAVTALLYFLLFTFEDQVLALTSQGRWTVFIPIAIAFVLSYTHGNFTASFWDWFGIKAKK
ncbi:MAG TPA: hypothetical protein VFP70_10760 [Burkholderiales bacterium]|nr:hypothetical protein [Burkholderiales bacterium]